MDAVGVRPVWGFIDSETGDFIEVAGGPLDAAWKAVEEALPEGWRLKTLWIDGTMWRSMAAGPRHKDGMVTGAGRTPAEALLALAARLVEIAR